MTSKEYSSIEGCIRQSTDTPIKNNVRVYVNDEMALISSSPADHRFMDCKIAEKQNKYSCETDATILSGSEKDAEASDSVV